jgi:hypothetical protein
MLLHVTIFLSFDKQWRKCDLNSRVPTIITILYVFHKTPWPRARNTYVNSHREPCERHACRVAEAGSCISRTTQWLVQKVLHRFAFHIYLNCASRTPIHPLTSLHARRYLLFTMISLHAMMHYSNSAKKITTPISQKKYYLWSILMDSTLSRFLCM